MDEYIAELDSIEVNGQKITDFKSVTPKGVTFRKTVELMGKTGKAKQRKRYALTIEYVPPSGKPEFDWEALDNGTVVLNYPDGRRGTYSGASCLSTGDAGINGQDAQVKNIEIAADKMVTE